MVLFASCKKEKLIDVISAGAKLTKSDAGKPIKTYEGIWWSESFKDSLVIKVKSITDSVRYETNIPIFDKKITHHVNYEPTDDNLYIEVIRLGYSTNVWCYTKEAIISTKIDAEYKI